MPICKAVSLSYKSLILKTGYMYNIRPLFVMSGHFIVKHFYGVILCSILLLKSSKATLEMIRSSDTSFYI